MDCHFLDLPDFQSSGARSMTASAAHAPTHASIQPATKNLSANDVPGLSILVWQCSM